MNATRPKEAIMAEAGRIELIAEVKRQRAYIEALERDIQILIQQRDEARGKTDFDLSNAYAGVQNELEDIRREAAEHIHRAEAKVTQLESQLADLRDFAYERAPKIAAEEANRQRAELQSQLAAAEAGRIEAERRAEVMEQARDYQKAMKEQVAGQADKLTQTVEALCEKNTQLRAPLEAALPLLEAEADRRDYCDTEEDYGTEMRDLAATIRAALGQRQAERGNDCDHPFRIDGEECGNCEEREAALGDAGQAEGES